MDAFRENDELIHIPASQIREGDRLPVCEYPRREEIVLSDAYPCSDTEVQVETSALVRRYASDAIISVIRAWKGGVR